MQMISRERGKCKKLSKSSSQPVLNRTVRSEPRCVIARLQHEHRLPSSRSCLKPQTGLASAAGPADADHIRADITVPTFIRTTRAGPSHDVRVGLKVRLELASSCQELLQRPISSSRSGLVAAADEFAVDEYPRHRAPACHVLERVLVLRALRLLVKLHGCTDVRRVTRADVKASTRMKNPIKSEHTHRCAICCSSTVCRSAGGD